MSTTSLTNGSSENGKCDENLLSELQKAFDNINDSTNFNRVAKNIKVISASPQSLVVELLLGEEHMNGKGTLHGGQTAALVDIVTARAVGITVKNIPMVSLDISVSYMLPVKKGDTVTIEAVCLKIGRNVAFTEAIFRRKSDNALVAKGRHNISILNYLKPKDGEVINQF